MAKNGYPETLPMTWRANIGNRVRGARAAVKRWQTTYPPLPRKVREELAAKLLGDDWPEIGQ